jgi:desert hedgehog protein
MSRQVDAGADPKRRLGTRAPRRWMSALPRLAGVVLAVALLLPAAPAVAQNSAEIEATMRQLELEASRAGHLERALNNSIGQVQGSIAKCLAEIRRVGANNDVRKVLRNIDRRPGQQYFNLSTENVLRRLERAAGRKLNLSEFDLEVCVQAYDLYFGLKAHTDRRLTNPAIGCQPDQNFCQGTDPGSYICCGGSTPICAQSCDDEGGVCEPYCLPSLSCFPGEATVALEDGTTRRMDELRIGDRVAVIRPDGTRSFDDVYLFTHKDGAASGRYLTLTLASGRTLSLSPRHFIPVATDVAASWEGRIVKAADELREGDIVWHEAADGSMASAAVTAITSQSRVGLYNPLTMGGSILVDGVAASAHSDWFLDGIVSPDTQAKVYQAILAPVRLAYLALGPERTEIVAERWGVVDAVRDATLPGGAVVWLWAVLGALAGMGLLVWRRRAAAH